MDLSEIFTLPITIFFIGIIFILLYFSWQNSRQLKYTQKVKETSQRFHDICELNSNFHFNSISTYYFNTIELKSKPQYDRFNFENHFINLVMEQEDQITNYAVKVCENRILKEKYDEKLNSISNYTTHATVKSLHLNWEKYNEIEKSLVDSLILRPVTDFYIKCTITYRSPQGRNFYSTDKDYTYDDFQRALTYIKSEKEKKESKEYQRKAMTQSLRYDVMQRDGFRCVLCGRTASDGVKLHVDHIRPVSKGGKTVISNLRTLCDECNLGKSDKYDEDGLN